MFYTIDCTTISIQLADKNRILNLDHGSGQNGNVIHTFNQDGNYMPHRIWKLERLSDDAGREEPARLKAEIAKGTKELSQLQDELSSAKKEFSEFRTQLHQRDETINQLQQDLKFKEEALSHAYKVNDEFAQLRKQHVLLESKFSHQQTETASLQAKVDRMEYLMTQSDKDLEPGAYQILNAHKGTAIQVSEHDPTQVVAWKRHDEENQQRSGDGYRLQNKHYVDAFLAASSTDNKGLVYASKYPTTWMFLLYNGNYIIQLADRNRVLDLYHGSGRNGTMIRIHKEDGTHMPRRIWRLKRLRSSGDCESKEPSKLRTLLHQRDDTIRQLRQELKSKEEVLSHAYKAIEEFALLRNQYELLESKLHNNKRRSQAVKQKQT
ncbi:ricin-type beta-trefoil lectin domain protein, putative, partial [Rhizoctonia solani AG-3 Rhs1AP]